MTGSGRLLVAAGAPIVEGADAEGPGRVAGGLATCAQGSIAAAAPSGRYGLASAVRIEKGLHHVQLGESKRAPPPRARLRESDAVGQRKDRPGI